MPLQADYHTHTRYSHGTGTVEQTVEAALLQGLKAVAISEHNSAHMAYGVRGKHMLALRREVDAMRKQYAGRIEVLMGVEANLLGDGLTDLPHIDSGLYDFLLLGYHRGVFPRDGYSLRWTAGLLFGQSPRYAEKNAMAMAHALKRYKGIMAVTHPGLYIPMDIPTLAQACADYGVAFELNSGHSGLTLAMALAAKKIPGLKFLLSSDAHCPENVGNVKFAHAIAQKADLLPRIINWEME